MNSPLWLSVVTLVLALVGCRTPQGMDELETESRFHQDKIWQLKNWVEQYHDLLDSCRRENNALRAQLSAADRKPTPAPPPFSERPGPDIRPPVDFPRDLPKVEPPKVEIPKVEIPGQDQPGPRLPPLPGPEKRRNLTPTPAPEQLPDGASRGARPTGAARASFVQSIDEGPALSTHEAIKTTDRTVARITLNRMLTTAYNPQGRPTDEGIRVVVEPRNAAGQLIPPAGNLSIVVLDPEAATEAEARVARWDFSAARTARRYRRTPLADGVHLDLPWTGRPPVRSPVQIHARLITPDGRRLSAMRTINVAVAEPPSTPIAPAPAAPLATINSGPALVPPSPLGAAALPPVRTGTSVEAPRVGAAAPLPAVPRRTPTVSPPEEAVNIPVEPGGSAAAAPPAPVRTAGRRPQWSPYR